MMNEAAALHEMELKPPHETYAGWLRRQPEASLSRGDRQRLEKGRQWAEEHPELEAELRRKVGTFVRLRTSKKTLEGHTVLAGTRYYIVEHWLGRLIGIPDGSRDAICLRLDWVR